MADLMQCMLEISEKSAEIAREIRSNPVLLRLLAEEKSDSAKNSRFAQDFKTLTDVLIQELAKYEIEKRFVQFRNRIFGEENGEITTAAGKTIKIKIGEQKLETEKVLLEALEGKSEAASSLSELIHKRIAQDGHSDSSIPTLTFLDFDTSNLGVWIDPIDGTNVYISSAEDISTRTPDACETLVERGLENVTVLLGVFSLESGFPVMGVVHQPFHARESEERWSGKVYFAAGTFLSSSIPKIIPDHREKVTVILSSADPIQESLSQIPHFSVISASGAGYKILCVILGSADIFVSTMASTYFYDTCAPHAILRCINGVGVVRWKEVMHKRNEILASATVEEKQNVLEKCQVRYKGKTDNATSGDAYCNFEGVLAYRSQEKLIQFLAKIDK